jgi:hypothetical protein
MEVGRKPTGTFVFSTLFLHLAVLWKLISGNLGTFFISVTCEKDEQDLAVKFRGTSLRHCSEHALSMMFAVSQQKVATPSRY